MREAILTKEQNIRRYIYIGDECRFKNSDKPYVTAIFTKGKRNPLMSLSKHKREGSYTREEFEKILLDHSWLDIVNKKHRDCSVSLGEDL